MMAVFIGDASRFGRRIRTISLERSFHRKNLPCGLFSVSPEMGSEPVSAETILPRMDLPNGLIVILVPCCQKENWDYGTDLMELGYAETNYPEKG